MGNQPLLPNNARARRAWCMQAREALGWRIETQRRGREHAELAEPAHCAHGSLEAGE
jgi:hypothetical protein